MNFIDLFSGVGGFRLGMEQNDHNCLAFCEIDKFARQSYKAIHNTEGEEEWHDITKVTNEHLREFEHRRGKVEVICGGFPCQAFSVAGKRGGFSDTRGTLFFEIARFASILRPKYLFLENVKGLLSHEGGNTFETILATLDELGYDAEWQNCNSKDFGVPQNRERIFIIGHFRGAGGRKVFPISGGNGEVAARKSIPGIKCINQYDSEGTQRPQHDRIYSSDGIFLCLNSQMGGRYNIAEVKPCLTPDRAEKRQNGRRFKENGEPMFILTGQDVHGVAIKEATKKGFDLAREGDSINLAVPNSNTRRGRVGKGVANTLDTGCQQGVLQGYRIRRLTPLECWRLQGFPDSAFYKAREAGVSDSQLYRQSGNSVSVPVIYAIAKRL